MWQYGYFRGSIHDNGLWTHQLFARFWLRHKMWEHNRTLFLTHARFATSYAHTSGYFVNTGQDKCGCLHVDMLLGLSITLLDVTSHQIIANGIGVAMRKVHHSVLSMLMIRQDKDGCLSLWIQYIPRNMHTVLLCFVVLWLCNRS